MEVGTVVAEDDGKDDTAKIARGTCDTGDNTVGVGVNMRHERVVDAVGALHEESQTAADEADQGSLVLGIDCADDYTEHTREHAVDVQKDLLAPRCSGLAVGEIAQYTTVTRIRTAGDSTR